MLAVLVETASISINLCADALSLFIFIYIIPQLDIYAFIFAGPDLKIGLEISCVEPRAAE